MSSAKDDFKNNIRSISNSISIYQYLQKNAKNLDSTILLRSQYVVIVSAFDTYVHSALINKIIEAYFTSDATVEFGVDIPLSLVWKMRTSDENMQKELLKSYLNKKFSKDSFQSPKSIEYAYGILKINQIWTKIGKKIQKSADHVKGTLALIVKRRNKIAHESDWNEITRKYEEIDLKMVLECQEFIQKLVDALDALTYTK